MRKKYIVDAVFAIVLLLLAGLVFYIRFQKPEELRAVMEINGQDVAKEEYQSEIKQLQAQVKSRYSTDEANRKDFWTTPIDGETPLAVIMNLAKEDLIYKKTLSSMAKDNGIQADMDYSAIKSSMEEENASRSRKGTSGEVTYGLSSYTEESYYQYAYSELEAELMEKLKKEQTLSKEELQTAYRERQDEYRYDTGVKMLVAETKAENAAQLQEAAEAIRAESSTEELEEDYPQISFYELEMNTLDTQEGKSGVYSMRWMLASSMQKGEISEPFTAGGNILIMKCLERVENGVLPFEQTEGILKSRIQTERAEQAIQEQVKKAEIKEKSKKLEEAAKEVLLQ